MATYVNDLRLKEIATGDEAGTWGTSTNTNLELIGEALGYGTQNCFASDADATTTVADGATDPARAMYFKVTSSATLTATRTLTIAPNTISRVMLIENATTGSQSITISQGSGSTVTIASGAVKMVYLDGAGAGGAVVEALADLELPTITVADLTATTADINGGTIDGVTIGGASAGAGTFTTLTANGNVVLGDAATDTVTVTADIASDLIPSADGSFDLGASGAEWQDLFIDGTANIDSLVADTADINAGTIDGTVIGGTTPAAVTTTALVATTADINAGTIDGTVIGGSTAAAGSFTTGQFDTSLNVDGTVTADGLVVDGAGGISSSQAIFTVASTTTSAGNAAEIKLVHAGNNTYEIKGGSDLIFSSDDGANERVRITNAGNVGIGTSSPAYKLDVSKGSAGVAARFTASADNGRGLSFTSSDVGIFLGAQWTRDIASGSGIHAWSINGTEAMRLDSSGNVGIGVSSLVTGSTRRVLQVSTGADGGQLALADSTTEAANPRIFATNKSDLKFASANAGASTIQFITGASQTERMRIDSSGNLLVGKTATNTLATAGHDFGVSGYAMHSRDSSTVFFLNRNTTDGAIQEFAKDGTTVGSIGSNTGDKMYIGTGASGVGFSSLGLLPFNTSTNAFTNNTLDLGANGLAWKDLYLSGGAYIGGTAAANKLDDYEEGTWTPTASSGLGGASGGSGKYTKVGRSVYCFGVLNVTDITADIVIDGLPFTNSSDRAATVTAFLSGATATQNNYVNTSATTFNIERTGTYSGAAISIYFACWYFV